MFLSISGCHRQVKIPVLSMDFPSGSIFPCLSLVDVNFDVKVKCERPSKKNRIHSAYNETIFY